MNTTDPGFIAARAVNAHPWMETAYPGPEDTDVLIAPPYPSEPSDSAPGHVEGRATWTTTSNGAVNYQITLAYEGSDGTVEDEVTVEITPGPLAWLDLASSVAELTERLHADTHVYA